MLTIGDQNEKNSWDKIRILPPLSSQGSLRQMHTRNVPLKDHTVIISWILMPLESAMANIGVLRTALGRLSPVSQDVIRKIATNPNHFKGLRNEFEFVMKQPQLKPKNKKALPLNFISSNQDILPGHINILFNVEGAHSFTKDLKPGNYLENLHQMLNDDSWKVPVGKNGRMEPLPLQYINMTHFEQNPFCNHAFAMKKMMGFEIKRSEFTPKGKGLTKDGEKLIDLCYSNSRPVQICIKHMSLLARKQLYALRKQRASSPPLMASHMGFTGFSSDKIPDYLEMAQHVTCQRKDNGTVEQMKYVDFFYKLKDCVGVGGTLFNPWSINLYDDDILEVINSNGLIGLNLDKRILGVPNIKKKQYPEKWSTAEIKELKKGWGNNFNMQKITGIKCFDEKIVETEKDDLRLKPDGLKNHEWHLRHLASHVLHAMSLHRDAWRHLALGSDYDGLIDPIKKYPKFNDLYNLRETLPPVLYTLSREMTLVRNSFSQRYAKDLKLSKSECTKIVDAMLYDNVYRSL